MPGLIGTGVGKTDALVALAARAGLGQIDPYAADLGPVFVALSDAERPKDVAFGFASAPDHDGYRERSFVPAAQHSLPAPEFCNGRPACFPATAGPQDSPAFEVAELPGGWIAQVARAPVAILADGATIAANFSSRYAPLIRHYDMDLRRILEDATVVSGDALVLCDDIFPLNYSHWLADTLPRLAFLGTRDDVVVVVSEQDAPFRRETLRACGIGDERILMLADFAAVRAGRVLVPRDCHRIPHPAYKAAPWAIDFLRSRIGLTALGRPPATSRRIYVSRADAGGRRVVNEDALMRLLEPLGYQRITLAGRSVADQAALFGTASHVVGLHGAGLTNVVFCAAGAQLLEILPASYGTPAFYLLAAGNRVRYASYVASGVVAGERTQVDDVEIDIGDFLRCCRTVL